MNSFGQIFRLTDFGESHGSHIGGIIDGCPANVLIDVPFVQQELDRRRPTSEATSTQRAERDEVVFISGLYEGKTTGAPIAFLIANQDAVPNWVNNRVLKPSHASFVLKEKFGHDCNEQGGRFSARQTACRVVAGAVAKLVLRKWDVDIEACTLSVAPADDDDTMGALVSCVLRNVPAGWGEPAYDGLDARLAAAMLSIPACKGFEVGCGFSATQMCGSQYNDRLSAGFSFGSNHDGGIQAGISNGQDIVFRTAFKPIPTLRNDQPTLDFDGNPAIYKGSCRNDRCVSPRVLPVVEAMAAITLLDVALQQEKY